MPSYRVVNPDSPVVILIIGPSQNGKTTFINRIIKMAANEVPQGKEGNRDVKCTQHVTTYDLEVPTTDYVLVDKETGRVVDVPDIKVDEDKVLGGGWWRKQTSAGYAVRPRDPGAPYMKLCLIDTPGLDDSENKDFENMVEVLTTLNRLANAKEEWKRKVDAIVLVYNSKLSFSFSFQSVIKHYHDCMPNLFGSLAVINTHFDLATLSSKKQHLIREKILHSSKDNALQRIIEHRARDFKKALGQALQPVHFFIDNKPHERLAYAELLSRNTISDVLGFLRSCKPMPITQMRLTKNRDMRAIDAKLQSKLQTAIDRWNTELRGLRQVATDREALRSNIQQRREEIAASTARCQEDLDRYDNDTVYTLQTYVTPDDPGTARLVLSWVIRERARNTFTITEPCARFTVVTENSSRGRWIPQNCRLDAAARTWTGEYEAEPGKSANLVARSQTTNAFWYRDRIDELNREKRRLKASMADLEAGEADRFPAGGAGLKSEMDVKLEALVMQVERARDLGHVLAQENPPIDQAFNAAARTRYGKNPKAITNQDLFDFVAGSESGHDILKPLRRELADDEV